MSWSEVKNGAENPFAVASFVVMRRQERQKHERHEKNEREKQSRDEMAGARVDAIAANGAVILPSVLLPHTHPSSAFAGVVSQSILA